MLGPENHAVVLANGRKSNTTVAAGASAGATSFTLVTAAGFVVNDLVFCSEDDDSESEYLGIVKAKDGNTITTNLPLLANKSAGMKVWEPKQHARLSPMTGNPAITRDPGMSYNRLLNGETVVTKIADTVSRFRISYPKLETPDFDSLITFWEHADGANEGLSEFALTCLDYRDESRFVWTVGITGDLPGFAQTQLRGLCTVNFTLERHANGYPI